MSNVEVERSIEAILMVVDEPVSEIILAQVLKRALMRSMPLWPTWSQPMTIVVSPFARSTGDGASIATLITTLPWRSSF